MEGHTIIILGVSSSEELIERVLKFVLKLFFAKITFKFFIFFIFSFIFLFLLFLFYFFNFFDFFNF